MKNPRPLDFNDILQSLQGFANVAQAFQKGMQQGEKQAQVQWQQKSVDPTQGWRQQKPVARQLVGRGAYGEPVYEAQVLRVRTDI